MNSAADILPNRRPGFTPDSRWVLRALMWITAGVGFLFGPASMRNAARLADAQHHAVGLWVGLSPWVLIAVATLFGTASQFEDAVFRRRFVGAAAMALGFLAVGLLIHYTWPRSWLPQGSWPIWILWFISYNANISPFDGAGPWTDRWLTRWFGPAGASETDMRKREKEIRDAAMQEERNRLAQDLHDSIKQEIFAIHTSAATIETRLETDPEGARLALERIRTSARDAMTEMEALLDRLDATPLENTGLMNALRKQCEALALRTGADVECIIGELPDSKLMPPGAHEAFFRIAQEALSNIGKHARATKVRLVLGVAARDLELRIEDNGQGFDKKPSGTARAGMGLANMGARAMAVGGHLKVSTAPGDGTIIRFSVIVLARTGFGGFGLKGLPLWLRWAVYLLAVAPVPIVAFLLIRSWEVVVGLLIWLIVMASPLILDYIRGRRPKGQFFR